MNRKYYLPYVIAQLLGYILCIALIVTSDESFTYILGGLCSTPAIGGLGRLCVYYFRKFRYLFGRKVRDDSGQVIAYTPNNVLAVIFTYFATVYSLVIPARLTAITIVSGAATMAIAGLISVYFLYSDLKCVISDCEHTPNRGFRSIVRIICLPLSVLVLVICVRGFFTGKYEKAEKEDAIIETLPPDPMDASYFLSDSAYLNRLCEQSLTGSRAEEADDLNDGYEITSPSAIQQVYYLEAEDPAFPFKDYGHNVTLNNAVFVVTNYGIKSTGGFTLDRKEWNIWVYPNFVMDDTGTFSHSTESEYSHYLLAEDINEVKDWILEEHTGMVLTEINR